MVENILIILCIVLFAKGSITYLNDVKIIDAIYRYHINCIEKDVDSVVEYDMMRLFPITLCILWDWGYKHILPADKFEIIKPYINVDEEIVDS